MAYIRLKQNQEKHDAAVAAWAKQFVGAGWNYVRSDLPGNIKPTEIGGYIPDIYASHNGAEYVIEIETVDSVNTEHAQQQKAIFQRWMNQSQNRKFEVKIA
jgi:hypothetical protein